MPLPAIVISFLALGAGAVDQTLYDNCTQHSIGQTEECIQVKAQYDIENGKPVPEIGPGEILAWPWPDCGGQAAETHYHDPMNNTCIPLISDVNFDYYQIIWGSYGDEAKDLNTSLHEVGFYKDDKCTNRVGSWTRLDDLHQCVS